ncbi:MAG: RnfABCDGE type electron transport complex subunit G [Eubacterium sp.]
MIKSKFFKNCLALLLITLVAGLALAFVNEITKNPIEEAENQARLDAYSVVFDGAEFADESDIAKVSDLELDCEINDVLTAKDESGDTIGYVMSVTSHSGYGGDIQIAIGISSQSDTITGFTVLSHSETAGLGAKCTEEEFKNQFSGKSSRSGGIAYVKGGGASSDTEIDAISGATITSSAVTDAVNAAIEFYNYIKD